MFYVGASDLLALARFERETVRVAKRLTLERAGGDSAEILYRATTDEPNDLLILGAAIWIVNEENGYHDALRAQKQAKAAGGHIG